MGKGKIPVKRKYNTHPKYVYEMVAWRCINCYEMFYVKDILVEEGNIPCTCWCEQSACYNKQMGEYLLTGKAEPLYTRIRI